MKARSIVVYTAITPGYDELKPVPPLWREEATFVAFLAKPPKNSLGGEARPIYRRFKDPCRNAKIYKILPQQYFPAAQYSVWVDRNGRITSPRSLSALIRSCLQQYDLSVHHYRRRQCIYQEAAWCRTTKLDDPHLIDRQMQRYFRHGHPLGAGLIECMVLHRRHTSAMERFSNAWYHEIKSGSRRDQLSFNYVARGLGFKFAYLPGAICHNPQVIVENHRQCARAGHTAN